MRDVKRIDRIIGEIKTTWEAHPDMRFFQLMINMGLVLDNSGLWHLEDDKVEEFLKTHGLKEKSVYRTDKNINKPVGKKVKK